LGSKNKKTKKKKKKKEEETGLKERKRVASYCKANKSNGLITGEKKKRERENYIYHLNYHFIVNVLSNYYLCQCPL
jgi:hypothetical protein